MGETVPHDGPLPVGRPMERPMGAPAWAIAAIGVRQDGHHERVWLLHRPWFRAWASNDGSKEIL